MTENLGGSIANPQQGFIQKWIAILMGSVLLAGPKRKYGIITAIAIIVLLGGFFAYQTLQNKEVSSDVAASELFEMFMEAREMNDAAKMTAMVNTLKTKYAKTPYANAVELFVAGDAVQSGKLDEAQKSLNWILTEGGSFAKTLARTRLARVQLAQGDPKTALETLNAIPEAEREPSFDEISGDIALAQNQKEEAAKWYEKALQAYLNLGLDVTLVQMKLNQITIISQGENKQ